MRGQLICLYWMSSNIAKKHLLRLLLPLYKDAKAAGYHWLALETGDLLSRLDRTPEVEVLKNQALPSPLVDALEPQEAWQLCLNALANLCAPTPTPGKSNPVVRLAWFLSIYSEDYFLQPKEQKLDARGNGRRGRPVSLKRLRKTGEIDYLTPQDLKICADRKSVV